MTIFVVLIAIALGISLVLILTKSYFPKAEKIIKKISFYSFVGTVICVLILIVGFRLKGEYTTSIIGLTFLLSTIILFGLTKNSRTKILSGILTIPIFLIGVLSLFSEMTIFFFYLMVIPFEPPIAKFEINKYHTVEVRVGGFLACGESLVLTESTLGFLDKQISVGNNYCETGIHKIVTLEFNKNKAEFLIYHDGRTETANPYKYKIENKNVW